MISYYEPLIVPFKSNNHYFWSNFRLPILKGEERKTRDTFDLKDKIECNAKGFEFVEELPISMKMKKKVINNCVRPDIGLSLFTAAFKEKQYGVSDYVK